MTSSANNTKSSEAVCMTSHSSSARLPRGPTTFSAVASVRPKVRPLADHGGVPTPARAQDCAPRCLVAVHHRVETEGRVARDYVTPMLKRSLMHALLDIVNEGCVEFFMNKGISLTSQFGWDVFTAGEWSSAIPVRDAQLGASNVTKTVMSRRLHLFEYLPLLTHLRVVQ